MKYDLIKSVLNLVEQFEAENVNNTYIHDVSGFTNWLTTNNHNSNTIAESNWEGKEDGRSPESVIATLIVHMNRFGKSYSKAAIYGSEFSTQDDFIYLINLKVFGEMSKMDLIRKNVQEKPVGMQIINRLIKQEWIIQTNSLSDKRTKLICISSKGLEVLEKQMDKIRQATQIVTGNLTDNEKNELIRLLNKLDNFHKEIYDKNIEVENLLEKAMEEKKNFNI